MNSGECDIRVELDRADDPEFTSDETISGTVVVEVTDDVTCNRLDVELIWQAHGRGNNAGRTPVTEHLFTGNWTAGETYTYDFQVDLPEGPFTYHGTFFNIDWELTATADISWSFDPEDTTDFVLNPASQITHPSIGAVTVAEYLDSTPEPQTSIKWGYTAFGGVSLVVGILALAPLVAGDGLLVPIVVGLPVTGIAVWMLYNGLRNYIAEQRLGDVEFELSNTRLSPGRTLECRVEMEPRVDVELDGLSLKLQAIERVVDGYGTHSTTYRGAVWEDIVPVEESIGATLEAGSHASFSGTIPLTDNAPPTFQADSNRLFWQFEATIETPGWPDWTYNRKLLVVPGAENLPDRLTGGAVSPDLVAQEQTRTGDRPSESQNTENADIHW